MGILYYGEAASPIPFDDRTLAHVQFTITNKLRRNESFTLTWIHPPGREGGRSAMWIDSSISLRFEYEASDKIELNRAWLEAMANEAGRTGGIAIVAEPDAEA